ncbi:DinB family protein [Rhodococcus pyridinivorans]|nr:DinB family protein [Rhodococcus pyridinivorans]
MSAREHDLLLKLLSNQFDALRNALSGLTDDQARSAPSASSMSLASLVNHLVDGLVATDGRIRGDNPRDADPVAAWQAGWRVEESETVADQLARLDAEAERFAATVRAEADLGRVVEISPEVAQWLDQGEPFTVRFLILHQIEEWARHAGHADIIRESIDGAAADVLAQRTS